MPDFIVRLKTAAAERWVKAVNADENYGHWQYAIARKPETVIEEINKALENINKSQTET